MAYTYTLNANSSDSWKELYNHLNHTYFGGRLPSETAIILSEIRYRLRLREDKTTFGLQRNARYVYAGKLQYRQPPVIVINTEEHESIQSMIITLLHEMAHLKLAGLKLKNAHGKEWKHEMRRLASKGAFDDLW